jgi:hypothetical protein
MTRRTRTPLWILASALALAGCGHQAGAGSATPRSSGHAGFGALDSAPTTPSTPDPTATRTTSSNTGGGTRTSTARPSPSQPNPSRSGPQVLSFTAKNAVCPVTGTPYADKPGQVTVSWQISGADTVDLLMDGGLWQSYPDQQGTDTLPFECGSTQQPVTVTHTYKLVIKNTGVWKTTSASAKTNPS